MKIPTRILSGAALFAVALTSAYSQTATTKPVGYRTEVIAPAASEGASAFNLLSPNLDNAVGAAGTFESAAGNVLTDEQGTFTTAFPANTALTLKITSGTGAGTIQDVTAFTATTVTTGDPIASLVTAGTTYELRATPTIASLFGAENSAGLKAGTSATADVVWIPNGLGGYDQIFRSSGGLAGVGWRKAGGGNVDAANTPISIVDGIFIQRRGTAPLSLVFTGHVQTSETKTAVIKGFNPLSRVIPVGITLAQTSFQTELTGGASAVADIIWSPNGSGGYNQYFYSTGGLAGVGWRQVGAGNADKSGDTLASGFLIQRKGDATNATLKLPTGLDL